MVICEWIVTAFLLHCLSAAIFGQCTKKVKVFVHLLFFPSVSLIKINFPHLVLSLDRPIQFIVEVLCVIFCSQNYRRLTVNYVQKRLCIAIYCNGNAERECSQHNEPANEWMNERTCVPFEIGDVFFFKYESPTTIPTGHGQMRVSIFVFFALFSYTHTFRNGFSKSLLYLTRNTRKW